MAVVGGDTVPRDLAVPEAWTPRSEEAALAYRMCMAWGGTRLDVSGCGLTELPKGIGQLVGLIYLNCAHNRLTELPIEIGQLNLQGLVCDDGLSTVTELREAWEMHVRRRVKRAIAD